MLVARVFRVWGVVGCVLFAGAQPGVALGQTAGSVQNTKELTSYWTGFAASTGIAINGWWWFEGEEEVPVRSVVVGFGEYYTDGVHADCMALLRDNARVGGNPNSGGSRNAMSKARDMAAGGNYAANRFVTGSITGSVDAGTCQVELVSSAVLYSKISNQWNGNLVHSFVAGSVEATDEYFGDLTPGETLPSGARCPAGQRVYFDIAGQLYRTRCTDGSSKSEVSCTDQSNNGGANTWDDDAEAVCVGSARVEFPPSITGDDNMVTPTDICRAAP